MSFSVPRENPFRGMAEEIDNVFENDQMYNGIKPTDTNWCVCKNASPAKSRTFSQPVDTNRCVCNERIICKSRPFSNRSAKIGVCASSLRPGTAAMSL
ncbi:hypothetical protein AVEN_177389-1 [Araneus ventricosus]|uniref:Uncharacterized protein n=1 Tax=Araneus ventricosus TaxID=182803 RepID=A0A4Y2SZE4_ARAVE|nr:hypothetical protein AVEN_177389-1 [Araneus ventricosus]